MHTFWQTVISLFNFLQIIELVSLFREVKYQISPDQADGVDLINLTLIHYQMSLYCKRKNCVIVTFTYFKIVA